MGNPIIRYEAGQTAYPFEAMTDSGDATTFESSFSPWSDVAGHQPVVAPYGLLTGGAVTGTGVNDQVSVAALTASMAGVAGASTAGVINVSTGTLSITRGDVTDPYLITSITVDSDGALAAVAGLKGSAFSETRAAAGGPPLIPVGSIEIGQVRVSSETAATVSAGQIFQVIGLHVERADFPVFDIDYANGTVTFATDLPLIHTGGVAKKVFVRGSTPLFAPISQTSNWAPADSTFSITSTDTYDGPVGSASSSLNQASFNAILKDGITDGFLEQKGKNIWVEFRPDRDKTVPKQLTQGILGVARTFPAGGGNFTAACTVTPRNATVDVKE